MSENETIALKDSDFREFFLKSATGRMVVTVEPDGRFIFAEVNDLAARYFDIPREEMLGKGPRQLFDNALADQVEQSFLSCLKSKKSVTFNVAPRFPGGVRVQAFILNPVFTDEGQINFIDVMARPDVVDSVQLQRERDDAIMLLTSLFDASGLGIMVTDHHGRIIRINDTFLADYGWSREDLLGEEFTIILPEDDHSISRKLHAAFIDRGRHGTRELQIVKKDGTRAHVVLTTALLELSQKRRFMVSTMRDVTERRAMTRNLKRAKEDADLANRAKSSFLANMSHELRTPLNAIIGFSELMKNQTFGPINNPKYEEYLGDIHFSARHLLDIINDVLDMSKIEAGKVELIESDIALPEVMESVVRIMSDRARAAQVVIDVRVDDDVPRMRMDQRLLRQILINLISNAVKFSQAGKHILVRSAMLPGGSLSISIVDEGCGIPQDKLRHVLEPFGQINDPNTHYKQHGQGTGLGLPLAKAMVELHDGKLALESEEGRGTTVMLEFPAERMLIGRVTH